MKMGTPRQKWGHGDVPIRVFALSPRAYTRVNKVISISPSQKHVRTKLWVKVKCRKVSTLSPCPVCPHFRTPPRCKKQKDP
jgi:hypothetical protein